MDAVSEAVAADAAATQAPAQAPTQAKAQKPRRLWWHVHQWVGLKLSILMSFVFLTGTLAVLSFEIDWLVFPQMRVDAASVAGPPNWVAIAQAAHAYAPDAQILRIDSLGDPWFAIRVAVEKPDGHQAYVYAHPITGAITGETSTINVARILRHMHRHLFMPVKIGLPIVTSLAFFMLISLGTAFVVYRKWWRGFFRMPRFTDARTFMGDAHRLLGVWSLWFIALIALTGVWYLLENMAIPAPPPPNARIEVPAMTTAEKVDRLAASVEAAKRIYPELRVSGVTFPVEGRGGYIFTGQDKALLVRPRANSVSVDPMTAEIRFVGKGDELTAHQRIAEMADPLHFGDFGGIGTKLIWFVFGLMLTSLGVSGVSIYALRIARRGPRQETAAVTIRQPGPVAAWWRGMGLWRWLALALIAAAFILMPFWQY